MRGLRRGRLLMQCEGWGAAAEAVTGAHWAWAASRVLGAGEVCGSGGGAEVADLGKGTFDAALIAGEEHVHVRVQFVASGGPRHLALLAVHELVSRAA